MLRLLPALLFTASSVAAATQLTLDPEVIEHVKPKGSGVIMHKKSPLKHHTKPTTTVIEHEKTIMHTKKETNTNDGPPLYTVGEVVKFDNERCGFNGGYKFLCDPDGVIPLEERHKVGNALNEFSNKHSVICPGKSEPVPFRLGVMILRVPPENDLDETYQDIYAERVLSEWNLSGLPEEKKATEQKAEEKTVAEPVAASKKESFFLKLKSKRSAIKFKNVYVPTATEKKIKAPNDMYYAGNPNYKEGEVVQTELPCQRAAVLTIFQTESTTLVKEPMWIRTHLKAKFGQRLCESKVNTNEGFCGKESDGGFADAEDRIRGEKTAISVIDKAVDTIGTALEECSEQCQEKNAKMLEDEEKKKIDEDNTPLGTKIVESIGSYNNPHLIAEKNRIAQKECDKDGKKCDVENPKTKPPTGSFALVVGCLVLTVAVVGAVMVFSLKA